MTERHCSLQGLSNVITRCGDLPSRPLLSVGTVCIQESFVSHLLIALMVAAACHSLSAQSTAMHRLAFDSVTIRPSLTTESGSEVVTTVGRLAIRNTTLRMIIASLYGVDGRQLAGGPLWIDDEPFDIIATARSQVSGDELVRMARAMLADRFQLTLRSEMRELPVYELTTARRDKRLGSGIRKTAGSCRGARSVERSACANRVAPDSIAATGTTIPAFAAMHLAPLLDRLIVDRTALGGRFDVVLHFTSGSEAPPRPVSASAASGLIAAVEEQLGLRLRATSGSVPVLVVDRVERPVNN
jgi:uncharacterized protein (TIGR03435 family)